MGLVWLFVFFFKQKTAYEMRISDWSSDVCSSDLRHLRGMRESTRSQSGPNLRDARVGARFPRNLTAPTPVPGGAFPETRLGPMSVDKETVAKIARLARVRVDEGH